jgi:hypothetical protein
MSWELTSVIINNKQLCGRTKTACIICHIISHDTTGCQTLRSRILDTGGRITLTCKKKAAVLWTGLKWRAVVLGFYGDVVSAGLFVVRSNNALSLQGRSRIMRCSKTVNLFCRDWIYPSYIVRFLKVISAPVILRFFSPCQIHRLHDHTKQ